LNVANIGHHEGCLHTTGAFHWDNVRAAIRYYADKGVHTVSILGSATARRNPVPPDLSGEIR
jgi:hypothetical protein